MRLRHAIAPAAALFCAAACSVGSSEPAPQGTSASPGVGAPSDRTTPAPSPTALDVSAGLRQRLVAAAAKATEVPTRDYRGLEPGTTRYAYDPQGHSYWAGGSLVPKAGSRAAAVSVQDNGSYVLFRRPAGGHWTAYLVGAAGTGGTTCPLTVPADVLALWGWPAGSCHPGGPG